MFSNIGGVSEIWVDLASRVEDLSSIPTTATKIDFIDQTAKFSEDDKETESSIRIIQTLSCVVATASTSQWGNLRLFCYRDLIVFIKCFNGKNYRLGAIDMPVSMKMKHEAGQKISNRNDITINFETETINIYEF